jgi:hypothetical protein
MLPISNARRRPTVGIRAVLAERRGWRDTADTACRCTIPCGNADHYDYEVRVMKPVKIVGTAVAIGALLAALSGCEKHEGPAEQAGKGIDNAVEHAGEQMEKAGDSIKDATRRDNN